MKKLDIKPLLDSTKKWFIDHGPGLLVGGGTTMLIGAVGVTAYATVKAVRAVDSKKEKMGDDFRPIADTIKTAAPHAVIPTTMVVVGTFCVWKGYKLKAEALATIAAAYVILNEKHDILEDKIREIIGKNKQEELNTAVSQELSDRHPESTHTIIMDQDGTWFYDPVSNTDFKSTITKVEDAVNRINHSMGYGAQPYASMNEFQHLLGIPMTENVDNLGWSSETMLELRWHTIERHGHPAFCLDYNVKPYLDYDVSPDRRHHLRDLM